MRVSQQYVSLIKEQSVVTKIKRNPEKFDSFELYTKLCAKKSLDISEYSSVEEIIKTIRVALKENHKNLNLVFGKRVESMFSTVAASLGKCRLVKQEDNGEIFCNEKISVPDFRIVLKDNSSFLVEVKNCHQDSFEYPYSFTQKYFESVLRYSEIIKCPLKFAIYFSKLNWWLLLSPDAFVKKGNKYIVEFTDGVRQNEMLTLGDVWLSTTPPIDIVLTSDPDKPAYIDKTTGKAIFIIGDVLCYCADKKITNEKEKELINLFALYSSWKETAVEPMIEGERLLGIKYRFEPMGDEYSDNGFDHLGQISSMVSNMYKMATETDGQVIAVETNREPKSFSILIPENYSSEDLPLWQFMVQPNKG